MNEPAADLRDLLERAANQDAAALGELFELHRKRLRRMVSIRMDRRLQGRLDPSDVLQEVFLEYAHSLANYVEKPDVPFHVWLRCIAGRKLHGLHRRHLGTYMRDAGREISIDTGPVPEASSVVLAEQLLGKLTAPSQAVLRAELQAKVRQALDEMEPLDREVLALRHYEQLNNRETAEVLGLSEAAASIRFVRALRRLKGLLAQVPGLLDQSDQDGELAHDAK